MLGETYQGSQIFFTHQIIWQPGVSVLLEKKRDRERERESCVLEFIEGRDFTSPFALTFSGASACSEGGR